MLRRWLRDRSGATAIEYALIASLIAATIAATVAAVGNGTNGMWGKVGTAFNAKLP